jgi:hypothetical protein
MNTDWNEVGAKYIVFKLEDWESYVDPLKRDNLPPTVEDAVVVRLKDPYAATALHAYTNAILTVLELMEEDLDPDVYQAQLDIADYFHSKAVESSEIKGKRLPD